MLLFLGVVNPDGWLTLLLLILFVGLFVADISLSLDALAFVADVSLSLDWLVGDGLLALLGFYSLLLKDLGLLVALAVLLVALLVVLFIKL